MSHASKKRETECEKFERMFRVTEYVSESEWKAFITAPRTLEMLTKPMKDIFAEGGNKPASDELKAAGITRFDSEDTDFTPEQIDYIKAVASRTKLDNVFVYKVINEAISRLKEPKFSQLARGVSADEVDSRVVVRWLDSKLAYLRGLIFFTAKVKSDVFGTSDAAKVVDQTLKNNALLRAMVANLKDQTVEVKPAYSSFELNNAAQINVLKQKELIFRVLHNIFYLQGLDNDRRTIVKELVGLLGTNGSFDGGVTQTLQASRLKFQGMNEGLYAIMERTSVTVCMLFISIFVWPFKTSRGEPAAKEDVELNFKTLADIKPTIESLDSGLVNNSIISEIYQVFVLGTAYLSQVKETRDQADHICSDNRRLTEESPPEVFLGMLRLLKRLFPKNGGLHFRWSLKDFLNCLSLVFIQDAAEGNPYFANADEFNEMFIKILKEVLKSPKVMTQFWADFLKKDHYIEVVKGTFASYPQSTHSFISLANALISKESHESAVKLKNELFNLRSVTLPKSHDLERKLESLGIQSGRSQFKLKEDHVWDPNIVLPHDTIASVVNTHEVAYRFEYHLNFIAYVYQTLLGMSYQPEEALSEDQTSLLVFFCKLVEANPTLILEIHEDIVARRVAKESSGNARSEYPVTIIMLLIDLARVIQLNEADPTIHVHIFKALAAILGSGSYEAASFLIKLVGLLRDSANSLDGLFVEFYECFYTSGQTSTDPKTRRLFYQGMQAILAILRMLMANERSIVENLNLLEGSGALGDQSNLQNHLVQEYQLMSGALLGCTLERTEAEICHFFCKAMMESKVILPFNFEFYFKNILARVGASLAREEFLSSEEDLDQVYGMYGEFLALLTVFISKIGFAAPNKTIQTAKRPDYPRVLGQKFKEILNSIPIIDILKKVLNVVESRPTPATRDSPRHLNLPLINAHLFNAQNNEMLEARGEVVQLFLINALECFGGLADLCRESSKRQEDPLYPAFASLFRTSFVNRDGLLAGEVQISGLTYQINFVIGLFMATINALDYVEMPKLQSRIERVWSTYNNNCVQWPEALDAVKSAEDSLFYDDKFFQSTGFQFSGSLRKHYFVSSAGFAALTSLLKYWRSIPNAKVPVLVDFMDKSSFDVPNKDAFVTIFAAEIGNQIQDGNLEVLEFLVECNRSQPEFVAELLKHLDHKASKANELIRSLKTLIVKCSRWTQNKEMSPFEKPQILMVVCNLALVVFSLLENPRLRKVHLDNIWNVLFVDINQVLLDALSLLKDPFLDLSVLAAGFREQSNMFLVLNTPSRAMALVRSQKLLEESRLVDKTLRTLMQVVTNSIFMVLQGTKDSFVTDFSQDFFRKFFERFGSFLRLSLSGELFTLNETLFSLERTLGAQVTRLTSQGNVQWNQNSNNFLSNSTGLRVVEYKEKTALAPRAFDKPVKQVVASTSRRLEFNPLLVYLNLCMAKTEDQASFAISDFTIVINLAKEALAGKLKLQNALNDFLRFVFSVGVNGTFLGEKMDAIPGPDSLPGIIKRLNAALNSKQSQALPSKHQWLLSDVYADASAATETSGLQERFLNLPLVQAPEVQLLNPFHTEKYRLPFNFTTFFVSGDRGKSGHPEITALEDIFGKISLVCKLVDSLHQLIEKQAADKDLYLGDSATFRSIMRVLLSLLQAANHQTAALPEAREKPTVSPQEKSREIFGALYNLSGQISDADRINSDRASTGLLDELLLAYFFFNKLWGLKEDLPDVERFWKAFVQRPPLELRRFLGTLGYMAECSPYLLRESEVNAICKVLTQKETTAEEIVACLQIFGQDYFQNPAKLEMYAESDLLDSLCSVPLLDLSEEFGRGIFYQEGRTTPSHAVFVHMVSFVANFTIAAKDIVQAQTKAVGFLAKYRQRVEQILGLWNWNYGAQIGVSGFPQEVYTFAYLEELQAILAFLRALSMNPTTLNGPSEQLFHRVYSQLTTQTLRFISTEVYGQGARTKIGTPFRIFDLFKPISLFEETLQRIQLKESISYQNLRSGVSAQRPESDGRTPASQTISGSPFNIVTSHGNASAGLLNFLVEIKLLEIIFLAADLFRTLTFHSHASNWKNQVTSRERSSGFYVTLSSIFLDAQIYLKNFLAKMSLKDYYTEGVWHLMLLKRSEVATSETRGLFQLHPTYSYQEVKNLVRRAFELTIFSQRMCIKCFESPLLRGTAEEIAMIRKSQDESQKIRSEFLRYENYPTNPKQSVHLNRSRREVSTHHEPLRSLNPKQTLMSQNLSIRTDANQSVGNEAEESHFFELHKKVMERLNEGHRWKS